MRVRISGYKIIKDLVNLEFKGLTLIKGQSNNGKTSILSAIYTALSNERGNYFINNMSNEARVEIELDDKNKIYYKKRKTSSGGSASYILYRDGVEYKLDKAVPSLFDEIEWFKPILVGDEKIRLNFINQFEPPILLKYSKQVFYNLLVNVIVSSLSKIRGGLKKDIDVKNEELRSHISRRDSLRSEVLLCEDKINFLRGVLPPEEEYNFYVRCYRLMDVIADVGGNLVEVYNRMYEVEMGLQWYLMLERYYKVVLFRLGFEEVLGREAVVLRLLKDLQVQVDYLSMVYRYNLFNDLLCKLRSNDERVMELEGEVLVLRGYYELLRGKFLVSGVMRVSEKFGVISVKLGYYNSLYLRVILGEFLLLRYKYLRKVLLLLLGVEFSLEYLHRVYLLNLLMYSLYLLRKGAVIDSDLLQVRDELSILEYRVQNGLCFYCGSELTKNNMCYESE